MNRTIWKYPFPITDDINLEMQRGAQILTVQTQQETGCIWALVDPEEEKEERVFCLFGTGHPVVRDDLNHIGSFQLQDGRLVFHLFEVKGTP